MKYTKTSPCNLCPFRSDSKRLRVSPDRLREFASGPFVCHKTAELREHDDETGMAGGFTDNGTTSQHCAGALIFMEHVDELHQAAQVLSRIGRYERSALDMTAPVFRSWEEVDEAGD